METITLCGEIDPVGALDLRTRLTKAASVLRPKIIVDLSDVTHVHVAATAALINAARQVQRRGGEFIIHPPSSDRGRRDLAMARWFPLRTFDPRAER